MKTLFKNATIVTMKNKGDIYHYMGIENDKIIYLSNEEPKEKYDAVTDLHNQFVYPCLTDSHLHLLYSIVLSASSFNICEVTKEGIVPNDLKGIEEKIKEYVNHHKKQDFIMINHYIPSAIKEKRLPTKKELDMWSENKEIVLFNIDGHSCSLSSKMLNKLNIESEDGILSGEAYDMIQGKITSYAASKVSLKTLAKGVANFTNDCYKYGVCKVCALDGEDDDNLNDSLLSLLIFIARRMDIDVRLYPEYMNFDILKKLSKKMKNKRIGGCSRWELDGSVGSRSAAFYEPFKDNGKTGNTYYSDEIINEKVKTALENNIQITAHAIGSKAIDQMVNAYKNNESLLKETGVLPRIDHFEFPSKEAVSFVCSHKIGITIQPGYAYLDKRYIKSYNQALNDKVIDMIVPLKTLNDNNAILLGSTDSPVQTINPYDQILGMTDYYKKEESLTSYDAFKTYTYNPSIVLNEKEGILDIGFPATFFISKYDIINMDTDSINQVEASMMYKDGKKVENKKGTVAEFLKMVFKKPKLI